MKRYRIGRTPENTADSGESFLFMLVNEEIYEMKMYHTSVGMMERGEDPISVSLMFRNRQSDIKKEEKYNVVFFGTPEVQNNIVKFVTNVEDG